MGFRLVMSGTSLSDAIPISSRDRAKNKVFGSEKQLREIADPKLGLQKLNQQLVEQQRLAVLLF